MYALGASSGGALVLLLALKMPFQVQTMCLTVATTGLAAAGPELHACMRTQPQGHGTKFETRISHQL